jgi:hypothetical protein
MTYKIELTNQTTQKKISFSLDSANTIADLKQAIFTNLKSTYPQLTGNDISIILDSSSNKSSSSSSSYNEQIKIGNILNQGNNKLRVSVLNRATSNFEYYEAFISDSTLKSLSTPVSTMNKNVPQNLTGPLKLEDLPEDAHFCVGKYLTTSERKILASTSRFFHKRMDELKSRFAPSLPLLPPLRLTKKWLQNRIGYYLDRTTRYTPASLIQQLQKVADTLAKLPQDAPPNKDVPLDEDALLDENTVNRIKALIFEKLPTLTVKNLSLIVAVLILGDMTRSENPRDRSMTLEQRKQYTSVLEKQKSYWLRYIGRNIEENTIIIGENLYAILHNTNYNFLENILLKLVRAAMYWSLRSYTSINYTILMERVFHKFRNSENYYLLIYRYSLEQIFLQSSNPNYIFDKDFLKMLLSLPIPYFQLLISHLCRQQILIVPKDSLSPDVYQRKFLAMIDFIENYYQSINPNTLAYYNAFKDMLMEVLSECLDNPITAHNFLIAFYMPVNLPNLTEHAQGAKGYLIDFTEAENTFNYDFILSTASKINLNILEKVISCLIKHNEYFPNVFSKNTKVHAHNLTDIVSSRPDVSLQQQQELITVCQKFDTIVLVNTLCNTHNPQDLLVHLTTVTAQESIELLTPLIKSPQQIPLISNFQTLAGLLAFDEVMKTKIGNQSGNNKKLLENSYALFLQEVFKFQAIEFSKEFTATATTSNTACAKAQHPPFDFLKQALRKSSTLFGNRLISLIINNGLFEKIFLNKKMLESIKDILKLYDDYQESLQMLEKEYTRLNGEKSTQTTYTAPH